MRARGRLQPPQGRRQGRGPAPRQRAVLGIGARHRVEEIADRQGLDGAGVALRQADERVVDRLQAGTRQRQRARRRLRLGGDQRAQQGGQPGAQPPSQAP
jgi:hypothetical protein